MRGGVRLPDVIEHGRLDGLPHAKAKQLSDRRGLASGLLCQRRQGGTTSDALTCKRAPHKTRDIVTITSLLTYTAPPSLAGTGKTIPTVAPSPRDAELAAPKPLPRQAKCSGRLPILSVRFGDAPARSSATPAAGCGTTTHTSSSTQQVLQSDHQHNQGTASSPTQPG